MFSLVFRFVLSAFGLSLFLVGLVAYFKACSTSDVELQKIWRRATLVLLVGFVGVGTILMFT